MGGNIQAVFMNRKLVTDPMEWSVLGPRKSPRAV